MWDMHKSSRELIKMQDFQRLGKLAAAGSHLESSLAVQAGRDSTPGTLSSPPYPCWTTPLGKDVPLRVPITSWLPSFGLPLLWGTPGDCLLQGSCFPVSSNKTASTDHQKLMKTGRE